MLDELVVILRSHDWALDLYMGFVLTCMVVPMLWLTYYYHSRAAKMRGGAALGRAQSELLPRLGKRHPARAVPDPRGVVELAQAIEDGAFGQDIRALQRFAYKFSAAWLLLNVVVIGVPLYAVADFNERHPDWKPTDAQPAP